MTGNKLDNRLNALAFLILGGICLWNSLVFGQLFPEKPTARIGKGIVDEIAYSPDGKLLAVAGSLGIWLYDTGKLSEVGFLEGHKVLHSGSVRSVAFSPDGKSLASGGYDGTIRFWDVMAQNQYGLLEGHQSTVNSVTMT